MPSFTPDVIYLLAGIEPGSALDEIRSRHQQARDNAQASYVALFEPRETAEMSLAERFAVACGGRGAAPAAVAGAARLTGLAADQARS